MARISSKVLFITTSPRTPEKIIPEIALLHEHFNGRKWNTETQKEFMEILRDSASFHGTGSKDPSFSARDRINRAPKMLGFVKIKPNIQLTPAGIALIAKMRTEEIFLRQLLKFQLPSPYHRLDKTSGRFWIKPYLELFRLIRYFGRLTFDEVKLFALQLIDYREFDEVVWKIERFREAKARHTGSYRRFIEACVEHEIKEIYEDEISSGNIKTRESREISLKKFIKTKDRNMHDYADACFRYLRATGMVNLSYSGRSISIASEKGVDVDFFLSTVDREPCFVDDEERYIDYLGNAQLPKLYTDDKDRLLSKLSVDFPSQSVDKSSDIETLKDVYYNLLDVRREAAIESEILELKTYALYDDVQTLYHQIVAGDIYDRPLMLEWNTWRAMTMLDGGDIKANLKFDDFGRPLSTAQGNKADIECDYGNFSLIVEVTMSVGQRQFEMEGEPVARHLGNMKRDTMKPAYCLLIAPKISEGCIANCYTLHKANVVYYGGKSVIIPLSLDIFKKMLEDSRKSGYSPRPEQVENIFKYSAEIVDSCDDEQVWYSLVQTKALNWLN